MCQVDLESYILILGKAREDDMDFVRSGHYNMNYMQYYIVDTSVEWLNP